MLLKSVIVVLLLGLLGSLGSGFFFLMTDQGDPGKRRLVNSLGLRLTLAATLMLLIVYGIGSGKLRSNAPWERHKASTQPAPAEEQEQEPSAQ
ncbi:MAG: DUF2909 family protein [Halieaceae bacterium]